jgi:hypothetical protein
MSLRYDDWKNDVSELGNRNLIVICGSSRSSNYELYSKFKNLLSSTAYVFLYAVIDEIHSISKYSRSGPESDQSIALEITIDHDLNIQENNFFARFDPIECRLNREMLQRERAYFLRMIRSCQGLRLHQPDREFL